jgi:hypothetical protein
MMGHSDYAPRTTRKAFTVADAAGALTVANGGTIRVSGFVIHNVTADTIWLITDAANNTLIQIQIAAAKTTQEFTICWVGDAGVKVQNDKGTGAVTVFHGNAGS